MEERHISSPAILKPTPRRPGTFNLAPLTPAHHSSEPSPERTEHDEQTSPASQPSETPTPADGDRKPSFHTSRSLLNLTASTLLGIYNPSGYDTSRDELATPLGTGAQTPMRRESEDPQRFTRSEAQSVRDALTQGLKLGGQKMDQVPQHTGPAPSEPPALRPGSSGGGHRAVSWPRYAISLFLRLSLLFSIGLAYGGIITTLHDRGDIAPVRVDAIRRRSWQYLGFWGLAGVVLGTALPFIDRLWAQSASSDPHETSAISSEKHDDDDDQTEHAPNYQTKTGLAAEWNPVVRSVGAFVGIAFAIRRLPWQSTLQLSLTLTLVNPVIWYLVDRTRSGLALSTAFSLTGAATLLSVNPAWIPSPARLLNSTLSPAGSRANDQTRFTTDTLLTSAGTASDPGAAASPPNLALAGLVRYESIGVATWIASVLFVSCVCFGNIGRRLASGKRGGTYSRNR